MADGFGFHIDTTAATELRAPADLAPDSSISHVQAGLGAGEPETWWGELVEFAAPLVLSIGFAFAVVFSAPGGLALLGVGFGS
jgi:hypothetical protein